MICLLNHTQDKFLELNNLVRIRNLTRDAENLAHARVTSGFDACSSLLAGRPKTTEPPAADPKCSSSSPVLRF